MKIIELIVDAYTCQVDLNDTEILLSALTQAAHNVGANIIKTIQHKYRPFGSTVILLLAESHISIYTWPEYRYATIEIFLCNEKMNPEDAWAHICSILKPKHWNTNKITHIIQSQ